MAYMLKLSDERAEQLRQIAAAKNTTIPELIADLIRDEIKAGTIPGTVPGIDLARDGDTIHIKAQGFEASFPMNEGPTLADLLRDSTTATADPERRRRWLEGMAALSGVRIVRTGRNSLKLVSPLTGREHSLPVSVAADLGDEIDRAVS